MPAILQGDAGQRQRNPCSSQASSRLEYTALNYKEILSQTRWKVRTSIRGFPLTSTENHANGH